MKCKTIHKNLIFYLEGELSANENAKIKLHLAECAECSAFAAELGKSLEILDSEKSPEVNPFFYTRVKARLESQSNKEKVPFWQPIMVKIVQPAFF